MTGKRPIHINHLFSMESSMKIPEEHLYSRQSGTILVTVWPDVDPLGIPKNIVEMSVLENENNENKIIIFFFVS